MTIKLRIIKKSCRGKFICFFVFAFCILHGSSLLAQNQAGSVSDSSGIISVQECIQRIENKNDVRIFYKAGTFDNKLIHSSVSDLPLPGALASISRLSNIDFLIIDEHSIVFIPKIHQASGLQADNHADVLLVGNLNEYGKYPRVKLSGTISDGSNGELLPGVIVQVEKLNQAVVSDKAGFYSLKLPAGEHILKLKLIGYEDYIQKIRLVSEGTADFGIFQKSVQLNEVIITDKRADNNLTRSQMGTYRLDSKSIRMMPSTLGETDIIKSISTLPGIQSPGEFGTGFTVRGGSADQNLILIEEVPLFNASHLFGLTTAINPDGISSVTLYKDGIPARFGERVSSVMSIRLGAENTGKTKVNGGIGILNSRLNMNFPLFKSKANLMLGGRSSYSNWLLHQVPDIDLKNSTAGFYDLNGLFTASLGQKDKIAVFGYYSNDKFSFSLNTHYQYSNLLGSLRWNHVFSYKLTSSFVAGISRYRFNVTEADTINIHDASSIDFETEYQTLKWSMSYSPGKKHSIDLGIQGILYKNMPGKLMPYNDLSSVEPKIMPKEKSLEISAFISDDFSISDRLSMEAGLRIVRYSSLGAGDVFVFASGEPKSTHTITDTLHYTDNQEIYAHFAAEPRLSFRLSINPESSVKFGFNRMNQFINLISNTAVISPTDVWKLSSTNFSPVTCNQLSVGYFHNFNQNAIEASVELYYKNLEHTIEYKNGAQVFLNNHLETDLLDAKASSYGLELYVKKNTGRITGWISYTYSRSSHKTSGTTATEQINRNEYFPSNYDIPNNLVVSANYQISRRWRTAATFYYNTGRPVTLPELTFESNGTQLIYYSDRNKYRLPDYHRLDVSLSFDQNLSLKKKWKGSWILSVINVYGRKNAYSVYYAQQDPRTWNYSPGYNLYKLYILGIPLPTLTYNFSF